MKKRKIDAYIACGREKPGLLTDSLPRRRIPNVLTVQQRMWRKVRTLKGRMKYARREAIVEPVIGQIKHATGFRQFNLRGQLKVRAEWFLVSAGHNLKELFRPILQEPDRKELALAT